MDRLRRADVVLAAALARSPTVVVPGQTLSPMDCCSTIPVERALVDACDAAATSASRDGCRSDGPPDPIANSIPGASPPHPVVDQEMRRAAAGMPPSGADRTA